MSSAATAPTPAGLPEKRRKIIAAARKVFAEHGFERASVDQIATRAGVSKATVYNHFADKKALFVAAVVEATDEMSAHLAACLECATADVEQALRAMGVEIMTLWLSPASGALYRQAIAEAARLPEIGRMVFERGTATIYQAVAAHLARWNASGMLRVDDPATAAITFVALCHGDLVTRMRLGVLEYPVDRQIRETVDRAVRTFVRAHAG